MTIHIYTNIKTTKHLEQMRSLRNLEIILRDKLLRLKSIISSQSEQIKCNVFKGKAGQYKIVIAGKELKSPVRIMKIWIDQQLIKKDITHQTQKEITLYLLQIIIDDTRREKYRLQESVLNVRNRELRFKKKK